MSKTILQQNSRKSFKLLVGVIRVDWDYVTLDSQAMVGRFQNSLGNVYHFLSFAKFLGISCSLKMASFLLTGIHKWLVIMKYNVKIIVL